MTSLITYTLILRLHKKKQRPLKYGDCQYEIHISIPGFSEQHPENILYGTIPAST